MCVCKQSKHQRKQRGLYIYNGFGNDEVGVGYQVWRYSWIASLSIVSGEYDMVRSTHQHGECFRFFFPQHIYTHAHTHAHTHTRLASITHTHAHTRLASITHTHTHTHTRTHTHTHTHTHTPRFNHTHTHTHARTEKARRVEGRVRAIRVGLGWGVVFRSVPTEEKQDGLIVGKQDDDDDGGACSSQEG